MSGFITRFFVLFSTLFGLLFSVLYVLLGKPTKGTWGFLLEEQANNDPIAVNFIVAIIAISLFITIWFAISLKMRDRLATKQFSNLSDPNFELSTISGVPKHMQRVLVETFELIDQQRIILQRQSNEKVVANDTVVQERLIIERQRLARELHDSVSQQLFAASMMLSAMTEQTENESTQKQLAQIEKVVQQAQLEMRALLLHLRPIALHNRTLAEGVEDLIVELQEKGFFHITYQIEDITLSKAEEDHLFRIAQEALSNTLRHAKASEVELLFIRRDALAILRIQDNGLGFSVDDDKMSSYGLRNIAERAVEIGCTYKIVSIPNEGTVVEVKVPLARKDEQLD
jgi:two-component system, NarL family, vancomycin resistance sensor histidine kinase VraS